MLWVKSLEDIAGSGTSFVAALELVGGLEVSVDMAAEGGFWDPIAGSGFTGVLGEGVLVGGAVEWTDTELKMTTWKDLAKKIVEKTLEGVAATIDYVKEFTEIEEVLLKNLSSMQSGIDEREKLIDLLLSSGNTDDSERALELTQKNQRTREGMDRINGVLSGVQFILNEIEDIGKIKPKAKWEGSPRKGKARAGTPKL